MSAEAGLKCKHCGLEIEDRPSGWTHIEGAQSGRHTCALDPYGFEAEPHGEPCSFPCRGVEPGLSVVES